MSSIFVDTSYILALELANDQNHSAAAQHWHQIVQALPPLITTSYVFDEIVTFFNSRGHHNKAVTVGNSLLLSPSIQLIPVDDALFAEGWSYFQQHDDKIYSLTDCISFVVMQRYSITTALTFDHHFRQAGFLMAP